MSKSLWHAVQEILVNDFSDPNIPGDIYKQGLGSHLLLTVLVTEETEGRRYTVTIGFMEYSHFREWSFFSTDELHQHRESVISPVSIAGLLKSAITEKQRETTYLVSELADLVYHG